MFNVDGYLTLVENNKTINSGWCH